MASFCGYGRAGKLSNMNYLGIDYGQKHIGLAQATSPLAEPLELVSISEAPQKISEIITKNNISEIVIGLPEEAKRTEVESFLNSLNIQGIKIHIVDETLTSHDARQSLAHTTQSRRRNSEHSVSAAILLQNWLDTR